MTEISDQQLAVLSGPAYDGSFPEENPFPVLRIDRNGKLSYANPASSKLLKQWQCTIGTLVPEFVRDDVLAALQQNRNRELELHCGKRIFSFAVVPVPTRRYVNLYGRDVTNRKRTETELVRSREFLKRSQEIAHLGSWELDLANDSLNWSDEVYRIFGLAPQEFGASYHAFLEAVHPEDRAAVDQAYTSSLDEGRDSYEIEHRIVRRDTGEIRHVHEKCEHFRDDQGRIVRSAGMVHDITERRLREQEIRRLHDDLAVRAEELADANRELEAFNFTVAHDLRKPLTLICGYCQLIRDLCRAPDEGCLDYLDKIELGTARMSQLIDALLEFSRLSHVQAAVEPVDLSMLAESIAAELQLGEPERHAEILIEPGIMVEGDPRLLQVVLHNLLGNAWKFSRDRNPARIEVGTAEVDGGAACFVRDNGPGFDQADADSIFTPFQRLKGTGDFVGFGIGLATVERIVHRHGGRVWATSEPGGGATFCFTLGGKALPTS